MSIFKIDFKYNAYLTKTSQILWEIINKKSLGNILSDFWVQDDSYIFPSSSKSPGGSNTHAIPVRSPIPLKKKVVVKKI